MTPYAKIRAALRPEASLRVLAGQARALGHHVHLDGQTVRVSDRHGSCWTGSSAGSSERLLRAILRRWGAS